MTANQMMRLAVDPRTSAAELAELGREPDEFVRAAVAGNASAALPTFSVLATDEDWWVRRAAATNLVVNDAGAEIIQGLAQDPDWAVRRELAANPNTAIEVLETLARDDHPSVRTTALWNPNTPTVVVEAAAYDPHPAVAAEASRLIGGGQRPAEADAGPGAPWVSVAAAGYVDLVVRVGEKMPKWLKERTHVLSLIPEPVLWALEDVTPEQKERLVGLRGGDIAGFLDDRYSDRDLLVAAVVRELAQDPNTNPELLTEIVRDDRGWGRVDAARNPNLPPALFSALVEDNDPQVLAALAVNPSVPGELLERIVHRDPSLAAVAARHPQAPPELLTEVAVLGDSATKLSVAAHAHARPAVLSLLAVDPDAEIAAEAVANSRIAGDALDAAAVFWADHSDVGVTIARHPNTWSSTLAALAGASDAQVVAAVAQNPRTAPSTLAELAASDDAELRFFVAENPSCDTETQVLLAGDTEEQVKRAVAARGAHTAEVLEVFAHDDEPELRRVAAESQDAAAWTVAALVTDTDPEVAAVAAANPVCPASAVAEAAASEDAVLRAAVAQNPKAPVEVLSALIRDEDPWVQTRALYNFADHACERPELLVELAHFAPFCQSDGPLARRAREAVGAGVYDSMPRHKDAKKVLDADAMLAAAVAETGKRDRRDVLRERIAVRWEQPPDAIPNESIAAEIAAERQMEAEAELFRDQHLEADRGMGLARSIGR